MRSALFRSSLALAMSALSLYSLLSARIALSRGAAMMNPYHDANLHDADMPDLPPRRRNATSSATPFQNVTGGIRYVKTTATTTTTRATPRRSMVSPPPRNASSSEHDAIFFNIFIDPNADTTRREFAFYIVQEQLKQIEETSTVTARGERIVYYSLIGLHVPHSQDRFCRPGLTCQRLRYVQQGYEDVTLQSLHEYCVEHPFARVTYIHDKGSYSDHFMNHLKRAISTRVVVSDECQTMPRDRCNVCTTRFSLWPYWHAPGNFWTADCQYVNKLLPPDQYRPQRVAMFDELFDPLKKAMFRCLTPPLDGVEYDGTNQALSLGRFNWEYWVFNHPDLRPCDAFPRELADLANVNLQDSDWSPNLTIPSQSMTLPQRRNLVGQGKYAWFRMTGKLYEFRKLYGRDPPPTSPLWTILLPLNDTADGCEPVYQL